jgi:hypothetical protein
MESEMLTHFFDPEKDAIISMHLKMHPLPWRVENHGMGGYVVVTFDGTTISRTSEYHALRIVAEAERISLLMEWV